MGSGMYGVRSDARIEEGVVERLGVEERQLLLGATEDCGVRLEVPDTVKLLDVGGVRETTWRWGRAASAIAIACSRLRAIFSMISYLSAVASAAAASAIPICVTSWVIN